MLKIKFWRIENIIFMKILEQGDEIERGNFEFKATNGVEISSCGNPALIHYTIYLRGSATDWDDCIVNKYFDTSEEAKCILKFYIEAIKEYNNSLEHPTAEDVEDIETVIAE